MYRYMAEIWKRPRDGVIAEEYKRRLMEWRRQPAVVRIDKPTRIDKARRLGYKAKVGFVVARVRVRRGGLRKPRPRSGRRPKRMGVHGFTPWKSLKQVAIERALRKYPNLWALGAYWVGEDGRYKWFEVILVDPNHQSIRSDKEIQRRLPLKL